MLFHNLYNLLKIFELFEPFELFDLILFKIFRFLKFVEFKIPRFSNLLALFCHLLFCSLMSKLPYFV